jgi:hypothetical protein
MRDPYSSWAAVMTLGGREYDAKQDCERLGLHPYLPQARKSWHPRTAMSPRYSAKPMLRAVPLFPRYFFLPLCEARARQLHHVRGLCGHQYLLASAEGRIWEAPGHVIFALARAENEGRFDEVPPELGDRVRLRGASPLSGIDLVVASLDEKMAQLFSPLFSGCRAIAKTADLTRAA